MGLLFAKHLCDICVPAQIKRDTRRSAGCREDVQPRFMGIIPVQILVQRRISGAYLLLPIRKINANPTIHVIIAMMRMK